jgi:hypothetical protein
MKVTVDYPSPTEELEIVRRVGVSTPDAGEVLNQAQLIELQHRTDRIFVDNSVAQYAVDLVMATREPSLRGLPEIEPLLDFGVSPRATLGLVSAARALALLRGRTYATAQDVFDVARDVLRHRIMLSYEALAKGLGADDVLNRILTVVPAASVTAATLDAAAGTASSVSTTFTSPDANPAFRPPEPAGGNGDGQAATMALPPPPSVLPSSAPSSSTAPSPTPPPTPTGDAIPTDTSAQAPTGEPPTT